MSSGSLDPTGFGEQVSGPPLGVLEPGPVWHASVQALTTPTAWRLAERALEGAGDAALGEWRDRGERVVHIRRRLTDAERGGLGVRDVRGEPEERERMRALLRDVPQLRGIIG